jgi:uncharacterized membrane protein YraQ (UPF0718 family)
MLNDFTTAGIYFLQIAGELVALFIGITFLVGVIQEYVPQDKIQRFLTRAPKGVGNVIGAGFGALTPFCSCSTIPILVGLLNTGVPFGICISFLLASPLLNPVIAGLLLTLLGWKITLLYIAFTFVAAVLAGMILERLGFGSSVKSVTVDGGYVLGSAIDPPPGAGFWQIHGPRLRRAFGFAWALFKHIFIYLIVGAAIGAIIYGFVPQDIIVKVAGPDNPLAIPVAAVIGIPMYIRAETIIPISAVLMGKGMGVGAVVALIIGGAGMSIPEISLLAAIFKKRFVAVFVGVILAVAVIAGFLASLMTSLNI